MPRSITLNLRLNANPDRAVAGCPVQGQSGQGPVAARSATIPIVVKQTGQGFALMYHVVQFRFKLTSSAQITDYLTRVVQPRLQTIDGVANAQILGGQTFAMRVWLDPTTAWRRGA